jgi:hypothetical protein
MSSGANTPTPPRDGCPAWADSLILELRHTEVLLGNIPDNDQWQSADLDELEKRLAADPDAENATEEKTEHLFRKISLGLNREGFSSDEIAAFVNARISYKGGPKYCDGREVGEALKAGR